MGESSSQFVNNLMHHTKVLEFIIEQFTESEDHWKILSSKFLNQEDCSDCLRKAG